MIPVNSWHSSQGTHASVSTATHQKRRRHLTDAHLLTRTSWTDASIALAQIDKGKASGNRTALWLRAKLQAHLFSLGCFVQANAGKVLFVGLLVLSTFCVGLKSATMQTDVEKLWVEEGGRLEKELRYIRDTLGEGSGSTNQILIQTPKEKGANVLQAESLLVHLQAVLAATQVTVDMFEVTWKLKDLCYSPSIPSFDAHYIDSVLENLFPCAIITPLDCFWEGSKLLGPEFPVAIPGLGMSVQWSTLNPQHLVNTMKNLTSYVSSSFPYKTLEAFMKRAGITTAYQEKPCLDPTDEGCPSTAPNKQSGKPPTIGAELTGGCYGFATKYMHWPEDLIVGGVVKNRSGHIVRAEALQTVVQLMAEREMYEFWQETYKVHNLDWTVEKARLILEAWQRKFTQEVSRQAMRLNLTRHHAIDAFSTASLMDIMDDFSEVSVTRVALGYVLMLVYACVSLVKWSDPVNSQSGIGIAGVLLVAFSVAAGLGFCALLGIPFNASTTQIVPFLALGLGVDDVFLLAHTYDENAQSGVPLEDQTGECLKRAGTGVLLTSASNACAFLSAAVIPVPALRAFSLQCAVLVAFNVATVSALFPAILSLDLRRRHAGRADLFCCLTPSALQRTSGRNQVAPLSEASKRHSIARALPPDRSHVVTELADEGRTQKWAEPASASASVENLSSSNSASTKELVSPRPSFRIRCATSYTRARIRCASWTLSRFASLAYAPFLSRAPVKAAAVMGFLAVLGASVWGTLRVEDGLDLRDVVPRGTGEHRFLAAQAHYFGFFHMFAVTQGNFEYPTNQKVLYAFHEAFARIPQVVRNEDGGLPSFWLAMFRDWLVGLQDAFDRDWERGCIVRDRWFPNASDEAVLAYKLLVQTGRVDHPVDKTLVTRTRLVDAEGIVNPRAFYNYLTAWVSNDALAYSASQANLRPEPRPWVHVAQDVELKIPKSQPLTYAQMPFYLNHMTSTAEITDAVRRVRELCQRFEAERGLPSFPTGVPFVFWEQYLRLRVHLLLALVCALTAVFLVVCVLLANLWVALLLVVVLALMALQLFGVMGVLGIRLSAVPAVILIVAVGVGVEFTAHVVVGFQTSIGGRDRRVAMALEHTLAPVAHGAASTLVGILMLAFSEFDFIVRYFFCVLFSLVVIGLLNGLLLLPVLLSLVGPQAEVVPKKHEDRISTPTPPASPPPKPPRRSGRRVRDAFSAKRGYPRVPSDISLTTITEEPPSYRPTSSSSSIRASPEVVVCPEVVVETTTVTTTNATTVPDAGTGTSSSRMGESNASTPTSTLGCGRPPSTTEVTTRVTATAKVKVELHSPPVHGHPSDHQRQRTSRTRKEAASEMPDVEA